MGAIKKSSRLLQNGEILRPLLLLVAIICFRDSFLNRSEGFLWISGASNTLWSVAQTPSKPSKSLTGHAVGTAALFFVQIILGLELAYSEMALSVALNICPLIIRDFTALFDPRRRGIAYHLIPLLFDLAVVLATLPLTLLNIKSPWKQYPRVLLLAFSLTGFTVRALRKLILH